MIKLTYCYLDYAFVPLQLDHSVLRNHPLPEGVSRPRAYREGYAIQLHLPPLCGLLRPWNGSILCYYQWI